MKLKKNLYWVMVPLYLFIIVMALVLNGVFTGQMQSGTNIAINVLFLLVVGILLLISLSSLTRMAKAAAELVGVTKEINRAYAKEGVNQWEAYASLDNVFETEELAHQFSKYQRIVAGSNLKRTGTDIADFIGDELFETIGAKHFNSALSGIFTGLGILGTFVGLSFGLISFSGNDIFTISDNVGPLLEGMKVAFHTSVYGMLLSISFSIAYRALMSYVYEAVAEFNDTFRECVAPPTVEDADMATALYALAEDILMELTNISNALNARADSEDAAMKAMAERFADTLSVSVGNSLVQTGAALRNQRKE